METVTAKLKQYRQSPRKVRLVADLIRGKDIEKALVSLDVIEKRASLPIKKLLQSAVSNAVGQKLDPQNLFVKSITVDEGVILYRRRFKARGRSMPIRKRTSQVSLVLGQRISKNSVLKEKKAEVKKTSKKDNN